MMIVNNRINKLRTWLIYDNTGSNYINHPNAIILTKNTVSNFGSLKHSKTNDNDNLTGYKSEFIYSHRLIVIACKGFH